MGHAALKRDFLDFFKVAEKLQDIRADRRGTDGTNWLKFFLNETHSLADKIGKHKPSIQIYNAPDFLILKMLRNHQQHEEHLQCVHLSMDEIRLPEGVQLQAYQLVIVPAAYVFRAYSREISKNRRHAEALRTAIRWRHPGMPEEFITNPSLVSADATLCCDGRKVVLGFDIFPEIYNITNFMARLCIETGIALDDQVFGLTIERLANVEPLGTNNLVGIPAVLAHTILTVDGYAFCQRIERA